MICPKKCKIALVIHIAYPVLVSAFILIIFDQSTKTAARAFLGDFRVICFFPWVRLRLVTNRQTVVGSVRRLRFLIWILAAFAGIGLISSVSADYRKIIQIGFGLAMGGACGNQLDEHYFSGVTDFIEVRRWPVFNLADVGILAGIALCVFATSKTVFHNGVI
jgi:signal peptidase II